MDEHLDSAFSLPNDCSSYTAYRTVNKDDNKTCLISNSLDFFYTNFINNTQYCNNTTVFPELSRNTFQSQYIDDPLPNENTSWCFKYLLMSSQPTYKNMSCGTNDTCIPITLYDNTNVCYCDYKENNSINKTMQCLCELNKSNSTEDDNAQEEVEECHSFRRSCIIFNKTDDSNDVEELYNCTIQNTSFPFELHYFQELGQGYMSLQCSLANPVDKTLAMNPLSQILILLLHLILHCILFKQNN